MTEAQDRRDQRRAVTEAPDRRDQRRGVTPESLITLANLGLPRRPSGARSRVTEAALPDVATASRQLGALISQAVTEADLAGLRDLQRAAAQAVDALLAGEVPDCAAVNAVARGSTGRAGLVVSGGELRERIVWDDGTAAAELARRLVGELAAWTPAGCAVAAGASVTWSSTTPPAPAPAAGTRRIRADGGSASTPVATQR